MAEALEYTITADDSQADAAQKRVIAGLNAIEAVAVATFKASANIAHEAAAAFEVLAGAVTSVIVAYRTYSATISAISLASRAYAAANTNVKLSIDAVANAFRGLRVYISPTLFTAAGVGAGILVEQSLKLAYARGLVVEKESLLAAKTNLSIQNVERLAQADKESGLATDTLANAVSTLNDRLTKPEVQAAVKNIGVELTDAFGASLGHSGQQNLADIGKALDGINDPVKRAQAAFAIFGEETAKKILPALNSSLGDSIDRLAKFAHEIDPDTTIALSILRRDLDSVSSTFRGFVADQEIFFSQLGQKFAGYVAQTYQSGKLWLSIIDQLATAKGAFNLKFDTGAATKDLDKVVASQAGALKGAGQNILDSQQAAGVREIIDAVHARIESDAQTMDGLQSALSDEKSHQARLLKDFTTSANLQPEERAQIAKNLLDSQGQVDVLELHINELKATEKIESDARAEAARKRLEDLKAIENAETRSAQILHDAQTEEFTGLARIIQEHKDYVAELGLSTKANQSLAAAVQLRIQAESLKELKRNASGVVKGLQEDLQNDITFNKAKLDREAATQDATLTLRNDAARSAFAFEQTISDQQRDRELRQVEGVNAKTVSQKVAVEQAKAQIEEAALLRSYRIKAEFLDREQALELQGLEIRNQAGLISDQELADRRTALIELNAEKGRQLTITSEASIAAARDTASVNSAKIIQDNNLKVFEGLKSSVGQIFDSTISRSKSFGQALADAIKLPFLAAIKEIVSSRVALLLFSIFGGGDAKGSGTSTLGRLLGGGSGGGGGLFGSRGAPGGTPGLAGPLAGLAGIGGLAGGGIPQIGIGGPFGTPGSPGGTPPFLPGTTGAGPGGGGIGGLGSLTALKGLGGLLFNSGSISLGAGGATTAAGIGGIGGALAGFATSPAAGILGAVLAFQGLKTGGIKGLGETAAGGALTGAFLGTAVFPGIGTLVGAAIGAGVGAIAGLIRLFITGAAEKIVSKVKTIYGITIPKSFANDPLLGIIKQSFGGNIDAGLQSQQIRDLIELYAMSSGQSPGGLFSTIRPFQLQQTNGALSQAPAYRNGVLLPPLNGAPSFNQFGQPSLQPQTGAPAASTVIQLDPVATVNFLQGQAVQGIAANPRAVAAASVRGQSQNVGRRQAAALQLSPTAYVG